MGDKTFDDYLDHKLKSFGVDEAVYSEYIKGILQELTNEDELKDSLNEVLSVVLDENLSETVNELVNCWNQFQISEQNNQVLSETSLNEDKIKTLIEKQQKCEQKKKTVDVLNNDLKIRLLEQYAELSGNEESDDNDDDGNRILKNSSLPINTNVQDVIDKQNEQREKQKKASEEKKLNDKLNREKEKIKKLERTEKEKKRTQKVEKRVK
nr:coiled-coil domain-containing protein 43-like isoform X2 [Hydra vulgaris]XP_047145100.1 coiled-coil domain-containing protein 43-like isoform X2 [Hydra vulgaris]